MQDLHVGLVDRKDRFRRENLSDNLPLLVIQTNRLVELTANQGEARARDAINRQFESWARSGRATKGDSARTGSTVALHSPRIALAPAVKAAPARIYTHRHLSWLRAERAALVRWARRGDGSASHFEPHWLFARPTDFGKISFDATLTKLPDIDEITGNYMYVSGKKGTVFRTKLQDTSARKLGSWRYSAALV